MGRERERNRSNTPLKSSKKRDLRESPPEGGENKNLKKESTKERAMRPQFTAKTEKKAIQKAIKSLKLNEESFDVKIIDRNVPLLFGRKGVTIEIIEQKKGRPPRKRGNERGGERDRKPREERSFQSPGEKSEVENSIVQFISQVIVLMGCEGDVQLKGRNGNTLFIGIESEDSAIIIGRKGKNIDALGNLSNAYASRIQTHRPPRIVLDSADYLVKRQKSLKKIALQSYDTVLESGRSLLLDSMPPEDRKVIHTTLRNKKGISTSSEGRGLYKRVRVLLKES